MYLTTPTTPTTPKKPTYTIIDANWVKLGGFNDTQLKEITELLSVEIEMYNKDQLFQAPKEKFYYIKDRTLFVFGGFLNTLNKKYPGSVINKHLPNVTKFTKKEIDSFISDLNLNFTPYSYQLESIYDSLVHGRTRNINILATNAGKSFIIFVLVYMNWTKNKNIFMLVPKISLLSQMYSDFELYLENYNGAQKDKFLSDIQLIDGTVSDRDLSKYNINIQVFKGLSKTYNLKNVDVLIVDEVHKAKSALYKECYMKMDNCHFRIGFTGTKPRKHIDKLIIVGNIGGFKKYIDAKSMIEKGHATPFKIKLITINHTNEFRHNLYKEVNKKRGVAKFHKENELIRSHTARKIKIIEYINTHFYSKCNGVNNNAFILANNVDYNIDLLQLYCAYNGIDCFNIDKFREVNLDNIYLINSKTTKKNRELIRQEIKETKKPYILFGTTSIMEAGINVPSLQNIMVVQSNKADEMIVQIIGRLLRLFDGKEYVTLHDVVDDASYNGKYNYFLQHFIHKLGVYKKEGHQIDQEEIWDMNTEEVKLQNSGILNKPEVEDSKNKVEFNIDDF